MPYIFSHISDKFTFGKHAGYSLSDVLDFFPSYADWCLQDCKNVIFMDSLIPELALVFPNSTLYHTLIGSDNAL